jgi:ribosomal protein S18 acetylase RimI-like enzyme
LVHVEKATPADQDAVGALDRLLVGLRDRGEALRDWIAKGECLVARAPGGDIVGFVIASCSFFAQSFIALVVVHPEHRRQGVATALIHAVEAQSPTAKLFTSTNQSNLAMQAVCESLGFVRSGLIENLDEGDPEIIYFKRLRF